MNEMLHWRSAAELPDADTDVLIAFGDGCGVLLGAWMGEDEGWVDSHGGKAEGVTHWAAMPCGPVAVKAAA